MRVFFRPRLHGLRNCPDQAIGPGGQAFVAHTLPSVDAPTDPAPNLGGGIPDTSGPRAFYLNLGQSKRMRLRDLIDRPGFAPPSNGVAALRNRSVRHSVKPPFRLKQAEPRPRVPSMASPFRRT